MKMFGESDNIINNLCIKATKQSMIGLSAYSVKVLLPILLNEIEITTNWRVKVAIIKTLGNMAYCSPK